MEQPVKTGRVRVYDYNVDNSPPTLIWTEDLQSISMDALGTFLAVSSKQVTAMVVGNQSSFINHDLRLDFQVQLPNGNWETITLGYFTVYQVDCDIDTNISKVLLYDAMMMMSTLAYAITDDSFPMTVLQLAQTVATIGGVTLDPTFAGLPNYSQIITQNLWKTIQNTSYRDVIQEIAQVTGSTAVVSGTTLLFKEYNSPVYSINETNLINFKLGQKWGNVNSVTLSRQPQNDNILIQNDADVTANGVYEVVIINNQIVDDDRTSYITPIYNSLVGTTPFINFYGSEFRTEGHGWYEVGDVITATLSGIQYPVVITEVVFFFDGSISEIIKSVIPTDPAVNKTTAGGILKTLYNTEIKVDKQNNVITSTVEQLNEYQNATNDNFTEIRQEIDDISFTIQDGGGLNQIFNSVGYSKDDDGLTFWDTTGNVTTSLDTGSLAAGALSGNIVQFSGTASIVQRLNVQPGGTYNLTFYAKKGTQGTATVSLTNSIDNFSTQLVDDTNYDWKRFTIQDFVPSSNYLDLTVSTSSDTTSFTITDLMVARGSVPLAWQQAVGEVANENITFDASGITVKSTLYPGAKTVITPLQFAGYDSDNHIAFALNNDTTEVNKLDIAGNIETATVSIVFLTSGPNAGMNFVVKG